MGNGKYRHEELKKAGGFKINQNLKPEEIVQYDKAKNIDDITLDDIKYIHDGWLELSAGKNNILL